MGRLPNNESVLFEPVVVIDIMGKLVDLRGNPSPPQKKDVQIFTLRSLYEAEACCMRKLCEWK
jgi:hypothetical protein